MRLQAPSSVTRAVVVARIQEEESEHLRPRARPLAPTKHPSVVPAAALAPGPAVCQEGPHRAADNYGRERQLREYRRANGLCYKCGNKYSKEHQCKKTAQVLMIKVGEFGEVLLDDTVHALDLLDANPIATCCVLSVDAVAGTESLGTFRLRALVGNQVMILLVDSGSTHTFVISAFMERAACTMQPVTAVPVRVANG